MSKPLPILVGATPWILYGGLLPAAGPLAAAGGALAAALAVNGWRWRRHRLKILEAAALPFLALALLVPWLAENAVFAVHAALAAVAWGSLAAGMPFTLQYARDDWPEALWDNPLFRITNQILTAVWGAAFTVIAAAALLAPGLLLGFVIASTVVAVILTLWLPRRFPRWAVAREFRRRNPHDWPAPALGKGGVDVAVVGAGIGGLAAAALLAEAGARVAVIEAHDRPGGFCTSWLRKARRPDGIHRYVFDAGVHDVSGLGPRGPVRNLLRRAGTEGAVEWLPVDRAVALQDGLMPFDDAPGLIAELSRRFPREAAGVAAVFTTLEAVYRDLYADIERTGGVPCPPPTPEAMLAWPAAHPTAFRWMEEPFLALLDAHLRDPDLKALLCSFSGYLTDRPELLTVGLMAPIFGYHFDGGFTPRGGSQAFADALAARLRGGLRLRTRVRRITSAGGAVTGVDLDGEHVAAGAVVYNGDLAHLGALSGLDLPAPRPSTSMLMVTLGVAGIPDLPVVTHGAGVAIANPSRIDPSLAPEGHAAVTLMRLAPADPGWDRKAPDYETRKKAACDALVRAADALIPGLEARITFREDASPATFARYALTQAGCIYGPALGQPRPPMKTALRGLVLAGAGTFPGAGVEAVVISGTLAADALLAGLPVEIGAAAA